jgi:arginyl-tRNA synthetase
VSNFFGNYAKTYLLNVIRKDLTDFGVTFDIWFSESSLYLEKAKLIQSVLTILQNYTYKQDEALWLRTTELGDDKDRVLAKSDGSLTYFTPDIAYHYIKLSRGYTKIFNL